MKHKTAVELHATADQPPSGGCVLKLPHGGRIEGFAGSAAFGRLRVETRWKTAKPCRTRSAAFGRLRVETFLFSG